MEEDFLIGGSWIGTAGYEDSNAEGEPNCYPFQDGIKFKDIDTVYVETYGRNFEYWLSENVEGSTIRFNDSGSKLYSYQIKTISKDEIVLKGLNSFKGYNCYLERK